MKKVHYISPPKEGETGILISGDYEKDLAHYKEVTAAAGAGSNLELFLYFGIIYKK